VTKKDQNQVGKKGGDLKKQTAGQGIATLPRGKTEKRRKRGVVTDIEL